MKHLMSCSETGAILDPFFVWKGDASLFRDPEDLIFGPDGNIYVSSRGSKSVWEFDGQTGSVLNANCAVFPIGANGRSGETLGLTFGPDGFDLHVRLIHQLHRILIQHLLYDGPEITIKSGSNIKGKYPRKRIN